MLVHELLNEDPDMVPKETPLIVLDSKYDMCMVKNGKDTKHTRLISRRMHFVRNGEKCKMHKIDWCEGGLQLEDICTKNVSGLDLTPRIKYMNAIYYTNLGVKIDFTLPELSATKIMTWNCHVDDSAKDRYEIILSRH